MLTERTVPNPVNIVFVHGLGGKSKCTWTHAASKAFWPLWISEVKGFETARIMTFGYDSSYANIWNANNILDIADFGKQLAHELWCHYAEYGDADTIFVAHNMGGLVEKQALILAHNLKIYKQVFQNTTAIVFIGTPHRGFDLADILKALLRVGFSERKFVKDLLPSSQAIKSINDSFGERSQGLQLVSFWESTANSPVDIIVPEFSAPLGFANEMRVPLNGDHLAIVKFPSQEDHNYRSVSRTIANIVREHKQTLQGHGGMVWSLVCAVAFSPDSKLLSSGAYDHMVRLWNPATGEPKLTLQGHGEVVWGLAFSPDVKLLASGSYDGTIRLWNPATGENKQTLQAHGGNGVWAVTFSLDGKLLASGSGDQTVRLWNLATGEHKQTLYLLFLLPLCRTHVS